MISNVHLFTSITANYLPKARVLAESAKRHVPGMKFHLILCDDYPSGCKISSEPFDSVINIRELPILGGDQWIFGHSVVEMCTAVKPFAFKEIIERHEAKKIFYFDPDTLLLSNIDNLIDRLDNKSILLTPHLTAPENTMDGILDNEIAALKHGIYNLGFLAVSSSLEGHRFLEWWSNRLYLFCQDDIPQGLFTDQRWIDLVPALFDDYDILRDSIYNVATWNLSNRHVIGNIADGFFINNRPVCFFHFSGMDSGAQELMLHKYARDNQALSELRRWYMEECDKKGQEKQGKIPCCYDFYENGERITADQRRLYRIRKDLQNMFPKPFLTGKNTYYSWYHSGESQQLEKVAKKFYTSLTKNMHFIHLIRPAYNRLLSLLNKN